MNPFEHIARRLVERAVRVVQCYHGDVRPWLGFDHQKLTYRYAGRDFRLTDVSGEVVKDVLA